MSVSRFGFESNTSSETVSVLSIQNHAPGVHTHVDTDIINFNNSVDTIVNAAIALIPPGIPINDLGVSATELWSSDKITTELNLKSDSTHTHAASQIIDFDVAADARITLQKGAVSGLASLGLDSKIPSNQLPALTVAAVTVVADLIARNALISSTGDIAVVTSTNETFIWDGVAWIEITSASAVTSVNNQVGTISLTSSNIPESTNLYWTTARNQQLIDNITPAINKVFSSVTTDGKYASLIHTQDATTITNLSPPIDARIALQKGAVSGIATLDAAGKIPSSQLNAIAVADVSVVADIPARNALTPTEGDVAKVIDSNGLGDPETYIYDGAAWLILTDSSGSVFSVNGQAGVVALTTTDIAEGTNLYYTDVRVSANPDVVSLVASQITTAAHLADAAIHFTEASIDHTNILNAGTNTHAQIDSHLADATIHFTEASIDHANILNKGVNTHGQIDTHLADSTVHRIINDLGVSATELWSSNKITTDLNLKSNTTHVHTASQITDFNTAADARITAQKAQLNGLASLDGVGKIPSAQLPALNVAAVTVVADLIARDVLIPNTGDIAVVTSTNQTFIWDGSAWIEITSSSAVTTVNGKVGAVTLSTGDLADFNSASDARIALQKAQINGLATLDAAGKIPSSQLNSIAITTVSVVADIPARNALTPTEGDIAKVVDANGLGDPETYIYDGVTWLILTDSSGLVFSVNGQVGVVALTTTDIAEGTNLYYTDVRVSANPDVVSLVASQITTAAHLADATIHFTEASIDHVNILNAGTNTHAQIDSHLADSTVHRIINDLGVSATELWSSNKITTELILKSNATHVHTASQITDFNTAADARITAQKAQLNGLASLDGVGKIPSAQLPALTVAAVTVVADLIARDVLVPSTGDIAVITSTNQTFIWDGLAWIEITSSSAVTTVNGKVGAVTLSTGDLADFNSASDARIALQKGAVSGIATLDAAGKIPSSQLNAIAVADVSVVADIPARNALTPTEGDVAKVIDSNGLGDPETYIYDGVTWLILTDSSGSVFSVNGQAGVVALTTTDIAEGTNLYYTDVRVSANPDVVSLVASQITTAAHLADAAIHFTEASIDHANILNVGTNTHAQIDTHLADATKHRLINDTGSSLTELWSSSKIEGEFENLTQVYGLNNGVATLDATARLPATQLTIHGHQATEITALNAGGAAFTTVQDLQNIFHSSGYTSGGVIVDLGNGSISVAAGEGFLRDLDTPTADCYFVAWPANASVALTNLNLNYVYVEWNAGVPRVAASLVKPNGYTKFLLGTIYRTGTTLHITSASRHTVGDHANLMIQRMQSLMYISRESNGGAIVTHVGTRNVSITEGRFWIGLTYFTIPSFASNLTDTFTYYYNSASYVAVPGQTQIDNLNFDDGGVLVTMGGGKYGVHFVYRGTDGGCSIIYGTVSDNLETAQALDAPAVLPAHFTKHAVLIAKIIIKKGDNFFTSVISAFSNPISSSLTSVNQVNGVGVLNEVVRFDANGNTIKGSGVNLSDTGTITLNNMKSNLITNNGAELVINSIADDLTINCDALTVTSTASIFNTNVDINGELAMTSTTSTFQPPKLTTAQRDSATKSEGSVIYNTTEKTLQTWTGGSWLTPANRIRAYAVATATGYTTVVDGGSLINTASSEINAPNASWQAFNKSAVSRWVSATGLYAGGLYTGSAGKSGIADLGEWNIIQLPYAQTITGYEIAGSTGSDTPSKWHIIYSNDGTNYISAHNQNVATNLQDYTIKTFGLPSPVNALYIGIQVYANQGVQTLISISQLNFFGDRIYPISIQSSPTVEGNLTVEGGFKCGGDGVRLGTNAGNGSAFRCVAVGQGAGVNQLTDAIAVGYLAGGGGQGEYSIAIGQSAAMVSNQGAASICIGHQAGRNVCHANTAIINATGQSFDSDGASRLFIKPIRSATNAEVLLYNSTSGEVTRGTATIGAHTHTSADITDFTTAVETEGLNYFQPKLEPLITPEMTSDTTPAPYIISASSFLDAATAPFKLFDQNNATLWHSAVGKYELWNGTFAISIAGQGKSGIAEPGQWSVVQLPAAKTVNKYRMYPRIDGAPGSGHPVAWNLIYSNDNITWTSAHFVAAQATWTSFLEFDITPVNALYWGIQVYKTTGQVNLTWCAFAELQLFDQDGAAILSSADITDFDISVLALAAPISHTHVAANISDFNSAVLGVATPIGHTHGEYLNFYYSIGKIDNSPVSINYTSGLNNVIIIPAIDINISYAGTTGLNSGTPILGDYLTNTGTFQFTLAMFVKVLFTGCINITYNGLKTPQGEDAYIMGILRNSVVTGVNPGETCSIVESRSHNVTGERFNFSIETWVQTASFTTLQFYINPTVNSTVTFYNMNYSIMKL